MHTSAVILQAKREEPVCTAIKRTMMQFGVTYKDLGESLGENLHTVWNWLNGRAPIPAQKLPQIIVAIDNKSKDSIRTVADRAIDGIRDIVAKAVGEER